MSEGATASGANTGGTSAPQSQGAGQPAQGGNAAASAPPAGDNGKPMGDGVSITAQQTAPAETGETNVKEKAAAERKRLKDHLKTIFPDREYESDEEAEEDGIRYIDELHQYRDKNREYNKKILDVFDAEPAVVDIIRDMSAGATFMEAIARHVDMDGIKPQPGDPDYSKWQKALSERETKRGEKEKMAKELDDNRAFTQNELKAFIEETGMDDQRFNDFANRADQILQDAYKGKITKDFFSILYKGLNFDKAIQTAKAQGEVKARNEKIKATIAKEDEGGDGLPNLREGGELDTTEKRPETAAERVMADIDEYNRRLKPLGAYLKQK